ncbi:hypothetical protein [Microvirga sp. M2]|uniref:hypothetical protein n=1 Tax=Microvirga sp. M2 TaxID=3073270 RepID=UPI0039C4CC45
MKESEFCNNGPSDAQSTPKIYSPATQPLLQSLLSTLADIDFEYERQREKVSRGSTDLNLRIRVLERLKVQHQERRLPYIQQLAILQERMIPHR